MTRDGSKASLRSAAVCLLMTMVGCGGGGSPTPASPSIVATPTPAPPLVLSVIAGDTDRAMPGVQVIVAGVSYTTDAAGQVRPTSAPLGATIDIIAPGYLDRQTQVRTGSEGLSRFTLWPRQPLSRFDEDYTKMLVYTSSSIGSEGAPRALARLGVGATQVRVVLPASMASDPAASFYHQLGADHMNTAAGGRFRYTIGTSAVAGSLNVQVSVAGGPPCSSAIAAYANAGTNSAGEITSASITYCETRFSRDGRIVLHELGHTIGLRHSPVRGDIMGPPANIDLFTDRELLVMRLMYQRPAGNTFPDNDRATSGVSSPREERILCVH